MAPKDPTKKGSDAEEVKVKGDASAKGKGASVKGDDPPNPKPKKSWKLILAQVLYTILAVLTVLVAIGVVVMSLMTVGSIQLFTTDQSGRVAGLVIVLVTAFVAIALLVYLLVTIYKKQGKPLFIASLVLLAFAIIQVTLAGVVVHLSIYDEANLSSSLMKVFSLSRSNNMKYQKQYHLIETAAQCCGYNGPNDYRLPNVYLTFPPDVPISCCPSYDANKSDFAQDKAREVCRQNRTYFVKGCSEPVMTTINGLSEGLQTLVITEAVMEMLLVGLGLLGYFLKKKLEKSNKGPDHA